MILGWAAVVTVPAVVAAPVNAPVKVVALTLPAEILPVTDNDVSVPTLVTFGCAAVVTVPAVVAEPAEVANVAFATVPDTLAPATALAVVANATAPVTLAPAIADRPLPLPVNTPVLAVILTPVIVPLTPSPVSVPTEVMLPCAAVVTVPAVPAEVANVAFATVPVTLAPAIADSPLPLPVNTPVFAVMFAAVMLPFTPRPVNVPTDVILPWAAVVTDPAVVAAPVSAPTNVVDVTLVKPATVVTVLPNVSAVLPKVTLAFANLA